MNCLPYSFGTLPPNPPPLNLISHSPNYLLLRSFQKNWTRNSLIHISCYRPVFDLVAGDHYFEWRVPGNPNPVCSFLLVCAPSITVTKPIVYSAPSANFTGTSCFLFCNIPPIELPTYIEEAILSIGADFDSDISPFVDTLQEFLDDFHRPLSPPIIPLPLQLSPLGPQQ